MQIYEATYVVKDAHFIIYVWDVLENYINKDFLFCKPTDGRAM